jgi:hypothetical protein
MYLLQRTASLEAREEFMRRLKDDERLFEIIEDNDINIDDVLDLPTNNCYYSKIITIKPSLAKHLYHKENLQLSNIDFHVLERTIRTDNGGVGYEILCDCFMYYDVHPVTPPLFEIDERVKFSNRGVTLKRSMVGRVGATSSFTVSSLREIVSYMFDIMHRILDENEQ